MTYNTEEYDQMIKKALATDGKTPIAKKVISSESEVSQLLLLRFFVVLLTALKSN